MLCVTHRNTPMWTDGALHRVTPTWPQPPGPPRRSAEGPGGPDACQLRDMLALPHGQKVPREACPGLQCKRLAEATRGLSAFMAGAGGGGALSCTETTQEAGGPRCPIRARMEPLPGHPLHQVPAARRPGGAETPGVRAELPPLQHPWGRFSRPTAPDRAARRPRTQPPAELWFAGRIFTCCESRTSWGHGRGTSQPSGNHHPKAGRARGTPPPSGNHRRRGGRARGTPPRGLCAIRTLARNAIFSPGCRLWRGALSLASKASPTLLPTAGRPCSAPTCALPSAQKCPQDPVRAREFYAQLDQPWGVQIKRPPRRV